MYHIQKGLMLNGLTWSLSICQFTDNEDTVSILFGLFIFFIESNNNNKKKVKVLTLHFQWEFLP